MKYMESQAALCEHFLTKLKYPLRCIRDMHRRSPAATRSREPSWFFCFVLFLENLLVLSHFPTTWFVQILLNCWWPVSVIKRVLIRHNLRIVKLFMRKKKKKEGGPNDHWFQIHLFCQFQVLYQVFFSLGKLKDCLQAKTEHVHWTLHLWAQIQTVLVLLLKAPDLLIS